MRSGWPLAALAGGLVAAQGALAWDFTIDDAFIVSRYARRIATGLGYTMNDGPPTDGVTGPLGLVPGLLGEWASGDPMLGQKLVGLVCVALAVGLATGWAARRSRALGLVTLAFGAIGGVLPTWGVSGLETGLATLALTVAALSSLQPRGARSAAALGAAIAAMAWCRPELAPAALVLLALREDHRALAWSIASCGAIALLGFRLSVFGDPLPLSAHAKPPDLELGLAYVGRSLVVAFGGIGVVAAALGAWRVRWARGLGLVVLAHAFAVLLAGGDWMPGMRLFVPVVPLYALLAGAGVAEIFSRRRAPAVALALGSIVIPVAVAASSHGHHSRMAEARATGGAAIAARLAELDGPVALVDVGYLAFASGAEVIDLGGVTDPAIARLEGGHVAKALGEAALLDRAPACIVLSSTIRPRVSNDGRLTGFLGHPIEHRIARMESVRRGWRVTEVTRFGEAIWYVELRPTAAALD